MRVFLTFLALALSFGTFAAPKEHPTKKAFEREGWEREYVMDKANNYYRYTKGKLEIKCNEKKDCKKEQLVDCVDYASCGPIRKVRDLQTNKRNRNKNGLELETVDFVLGVLTTCPVDFKTVLEGKFQGVTLNRNAVFLKGRDLFTCEVKDGLECIDHVLEGKEFDKCLMQESCVQNFRGEEGEQRRCL